MTTAQTFRSEQSATDHADVLANRAISDAHDALYTALVDAGHDVALWADDASMLRSYAEAIRFEV